MEVVGGALIVLLKKIGEMSFFSPTRTHTA